jgi:predicted nucleic acid-binding protein
MTELVVADTCSLLNFAAVRRLDLLEDVFARVRCVEAVILELRELSAETPELLGVLAAPWFGLPIVIDEPGAVAAVERLRCQALGGRRGLARQHLGEAQSIHALTTVPSLIGSTLLTDDLAAADYARRRGVRVLDSTDVLSTAYDRDVVGCPEAYEVLLAMRAARRGVRVPPTHYAVCPPAS